MMNSGCLLLVPASHILESEVSICEKGEVNSCIRGS